MKCYWKKQLKQILNSKISADQKTKFTFIGVGNELNGDDCLGVYIVDNLSNRLPASSHIQILNSGTAPENFSGAIKRFKPNHVIFIDAVNMSAETGNIEMIQWADTENPGFSTHSISPSLLASYLANEIGCKVHLLGIQPKQVEYGTPMSPKVIEAADLVVNTIEQYLINP